MQVSNRIIKASAVVSCRIKRKAIVSLSVLSVLIAASEIRAGTLLFDTAAIPTGTSTLIIGDWNWPFHRFEVISTTTLATVGGYFGNHTGAAIVVFAAIVELSGPTDNPDSLDLTTPDVLGTTLIHLGTADDAYSSTLPLTLVPGWYALEFGTGEFGAPSVQSLFDVGMPEHSVDLDPTQFAMVAIQVGHPSLPPQFTAVSTPTRFFATIPEPATILLLPWAGLALQASRRRRGVKRRR